MKKNIFKILCLLILFCGIFLRILYFSYGRPFWNDESALALNLLNKGFFDLFLPLDFNQVTPPLYSWLCKICGFFPGPDEYMFRLPALLFGLGALPLFFLLAKQVLRNKVAILFSLMLFALNYQMVYYSQELKQYACDVFLFIFVLLSYFYIKKQTPDNKALWILGLFFAVFPWLSYTSVFAIFVIFLLILQNKRQLILPIFLFPFVSLVMLFFYVQRFHYDKMLNDFWQTGYISKDFSNFIQIITDNMQFYFVDFHIKLLIIILFIFGLFLLFKNYKKTLSLILLYPVGTAFLLSYFDFYPVYLRTALYLIPVLFLIMAKPLIHLNCKNKIINYFITCVIFSCFFVFTINTDYIQIIRKEYYKEDTPHFLNIFNEKANPDDILVIPELTVINFRYYSPDILKKPYTVYVLKKQFFDFNEIKNIFDYLPKNKTYYILFTHSADKNLVYENLCYYANLHKGAEIFSDKSYNALIKFEK